MIMQSIIFAAPGFWIIEYQLVPSITLVFYHLSANYIVVRIYLQLAAVRLRTLKMTFEIAYDFMVERVAIGG